MARIRSPNYPAMSLPTAIDKIRAIHKAEGQNHVDRDTVAKLMGFGGLNGASATALSALAKYGLLEATENKEARVTDLAVRILFPHDQREKEGALLEAAERPTLFKEIKEKWPDRPPSDDNLKAFLIRKGFNQGFIEQVIQIYRDTIDIISGNGGGYDSANQTKESPMQALPPTAVDSTTPTTHGPSPGKYVSAPPLPAGRPFTVNFDGRSLTGTIAITSSRDIDRLVKVLMAQKAAFEAMAEDDDEFGLGESVDSK